MASLIFRLVVRGGVIFCELFVMMMMRRWMDSISADIFVRRPASSCPVRGWYREVPRQFSWTNSTLRKFSTSLMVYERDFCG